MKDKYVVSCKFFKVEVTGGFRCKYGKGCYFNDNYAGQCRNFEVTWTFFLINKQHLIEIK